MDGDLDGDLDDDIDGDIDGDIDEPLPKARSWWWLLVPVAVAAVVIAGAAVYVSRGGTTHGQAADARPPAPPTPAADLEPRLTGAACRNAKPGLCGDDPQGLAAVPVTVEEWRHRLPEQDRPDYEPQLHDGLLEGEARFTVTVQDGMTGSMDANGNLVMDPTPKPVDLILPGRVTLVYGPDRRLRTLDCRFDGGQLREMAPVMFEFVKQCVLATLTADIAQPTKAWLDAKLQPPATATATATAAPVTGTWSCGWLTVSVTVLATHVDTAVTAPADRTAAPCAERPAG